jgi:hypothetical protein
MLCFRQSEWTGEIKSQSVYDSDVGVSGEKSINHLKPTGYAIHQQV